MQVAILDYQAGNATSVARAIAQTGLPITVTITTDPAQVARADRVIFPGVGAAGSCMANLRAGGLDRALSAVITAQKPLLCVCVGLQLLFERSAEDGGVACLGLLPGEVVRFQSDDPTIKIPHMGWNQVETTGDPLFDGIPANSDFYFVHSYFAQPGTGVEVIARADHGGRFCAGVRRGPLAAVQFHPEKSGPVGLRLIANFLRN